MGVEQCILTHRFSISIPGSWKSGPCTARQTKQLHGFLLTALLNNETHSAQPVEICTHLSWNLSSAVVAVNLGQRAIRVAEDRMIFGDPSVTFPETES